MSIAVPSSMSSPLIPKKPEIAKVLVMEDSLKMVLRGMLSCASYALVNEVDSFFYQ